MKSSAFTLGVIGIGLTLACAPASDTEEMVRSALDAAAIHDVFVDLDRDGQTIHLEGSVDTLAERTRAEELALAILGAEGRVQNDIEVTGLGPLRRSSAQ